MFSMAASVVRLKYHSIVTLLRIGFRITINPSFHVRDTKSLAWCGTLHPSTKHSKRTLALGKIEFIPNQNAMIHLCILKPWFFIPLFQYILLSQVTPGRTWYVFNIVKCSLQHSSFRNFESTQWRNSWLSIFQHLFSDNCFDSLYVHHSYRYHCAPITLQMYIEKLQEFTKVNIVRASTPNEKFTQILLSSQYFFASPELKRYIWIKNCIEVDFAMIVSSDYKFDSNFTFSIWLQNFRS